MVQTLDSLLAHVGPLAFVVLGLAAFLEYIVPPVPGDTIVLLGGVYAVRGEQPFWLVFVSVVTGSILGAISNFAFGHYLARRIHEHPGAKPLFGITPERLAVTQARMRTHGDWLLLINRFLPGIRILCFVAAGAAHMKPGRTLVLGSLGAAVHTGVILGAGVAVGGNLEKLEAFMRRSQGVAVGIALVVVAGLLAFRWVRNRRLARAAALAASLERPRTQGTDAPTEGTP